LSAAITRESYAISCSRRSVTCSSPASAYGCGGKKGAGGVTICQVHTAAEALLDALSFGREARDRKIERVSQIIQQTQKANAAATRSHAKARRRKLRVLGIRAELLSSCIPP